MEFYLLVGAAVCLLCVSASGISRKIGVPALLIFLVLGMVFGSDGIFKIEFSDFHLTESVCMVALLFIMFYGGFGTNWNQARPVAVQAVCLSTIGVVLTAGLTGVFCHYALKMTWLEGLLIGSVISSTDAASVFSILRTKKLNLSGGLASMLEVESGSNDPIAYLLTAVLLSVMAGESVSVPLMLARQILLGLGGGFLIGGIAVYIMKRKAMPGNMSYIYMVAMALLAYAAPSILGGNGYLSVYIAGIMLGNQRIHGKAELVHFFDGVTGMMQILLFFLLGLLSFPSRMVKNIPSALLIALFLTLVARPVAVGALLTPFRVPFRQQLLVAWSGLRGAASIVFAIMAVVSPAYMKYDIFHIVFCICLLSVAVQGSLLPKVAYKLGVIDDSNDIRKTFTDYQTENDAVLIEAELKEGHPWIGKN